jgi:hypothetical protein
VRLSERHLLQAVEGGPAGEVDRLVLLDEADGTEIVLPVDVAARLRVGLDYFLDMIEATSEVDGLRIVGGQILRRVDGRWQP